MFGTPTILNRLRGSRSFLLVRFECVGGRFFKRLACSRGAFTLVELLLVMTLLVILISVSAPTLANFFRGRTLDSEARRLLALTHHGQSRAVSEGIPMVLWVDEKEKKYGLEQEDGWEEEDARAVEFRADSDLKLEVVADRRSQTNLYTAFAANFARSLESSIRPKLPEIRFLPDGSFSPTSFRALKLTDRHGFTILLAQATNRIDFELRKDLETNEEELAPSKGTEEER
jgi:Tfp pilus assembly protein FimT